MLNFVASKITIDEGPAMVFTKGHASQAAEKRYKEPKWDGGQ
jgi:hypothetical protein